MDFHPDMAFEVDWALKINYLSILWTLFFEQDGTLLSRLMDFLAGWDMLSRLMDFLAGSDMLSRLTELSAGWDIALKTDGLLSRMGHCSQD